MIRGEKKRNDARLSLALLLLFLTIIKAVMLLTSANCFERTLRNPNQRLILTRSFYQRALLMHNLTSHISLGGETPYHSQRKSVSCSSFSVQCSSFASESVIMVGSTLLSLNENMCSYSSEDNIKR